MKLSAVLAPACIASLSVLLGVALGGCPEKIEEDKPGDDAGTQIISCEAPEDCPTSQPTCRFGVCVLECQTDAACDALPGTFCGSQQLCEPGCRTSSECAGGKVCQAGTCTEGATCGSKCDCAVGQVCNAGRCESPPEACTGPQDCPRGPLSPEDVCEAYRCDGFTDTCLETAPVPCGNASDCVGRLGCEGGCVCSPSQQCVPDAACTIATERDDCGVGFFCDNDLRCAATPVCGQDSDCAAAGLVCDEGRAVCVRPQQCTTSPDCAGATPATHCDTRTTPSYCAIPNCINGAVSCGSGQTCAADGRCVTQGTGDPCTTDTTCPADQYCAFVNGTGACAPGCRGNGDCNVNELCNAAHDCVPSGTLSGIDGPCVEDANCQDGLKCSDGSCQEGCDAFDVGECDPQGADCCSLTAYPCCNLINVCSDGIFGTGNCLTPP